MGKAIELLSGFAVAPGVAAQVNLTMAVGNSLSVRNCRLDADVRLLQMWADWQTAGVLRVKSPKLHDNVQGIRIKGVASEVKPLLPPGLGQKLIPQDALTFDISGSAVAGDIESACLLLYYSDLPGSDARLITYDEVMKRAANIVTVTTSHVAALVGGYSGEVALNSSYDLLKANTDYALLGYHVTAEAAAVRWRGADTANLGVGGPGDELAADITDSWFLDLAKAHGLALVPVFNSANKAGILVDIVSDENALTLNVESIFAEVGPGSLAGAGR